MDERPQPDARRPIAARGAKWASASASWLAMHGVAPNRISLASIVFALIAAACFAASPHVAPIPAVLLLASVPVWIALRSICNLLDGMIAVEHRKATPAGVLFNEFPDRISDAAFFIGAGFAATPAAAGLHLGWTCAALAILTAYTRALAASAGVSHDFRGPMAKPQRMAALALGATAAAIETALTHSTYALTITLAIIALGCVITIARRLHCAARQLSAVP